MERDYPQTLIENLLSEIKFTERKSQLLKQNNKEEKEILSFVTQYQHSVSTIECFHSRGQHLCKFIGTKEAFA